MWKIMLKQAMWLCGLKFDFQLLEFVSHLATSSSLYKNPLSWDTKAYDGKKNIEPVATQPNKK